jgi:hypothetical protein
LLLDMSVALNLVARAARMVVLAGGQSSDQRLISRLRAVAIGAIEARL